jgi:hypothetical protein
MNLSLRNSIIVLSAVLLLNSCTVQKRMYMQGFNIGWHKVNHISEKCEPIKEGKVHHKTVVEQDTLLLVKTTYELAPLPINSNVIAPLDKNKKQLLSSSQKPNIQLLQRLKSTNKTKTFRQYNHTNFIDINFVWAVLFLLAAALAIPSFWTLVFAILGVFFLRKNKNISNQLFGRDSDQNNTKPNGFSLLSLAFGLLSFFGLFLIAPILYAIIYFVYPLWIIFTPLLFAILAIYFGNMSTKINLNPENYSSVRIAKVGMFLGLLVTFVYILSFLYLLSFI